MVKNAWKVFNIYERGLALFFMVNLFLDVINKKILNSIIPAEIIGYSFWLSLGLYLGFLLCKKETKRAWKKYTEDEKNRRPPFSEN